MGILIWIQSELPENPGELGSKLQNCIFNMEKALNEKQRKEDYEGSLADALDALKCFWHMVSMPDYVHYLLTQGLNLQEIVEIQTKADHVISGIIKLEKMNKIFPPPPIQILGEGSKIGSLADLVGRRRHHHHHRHPPQTPDIEGFRGGFLEVDECNCG